MTRATHHAGVPRQTQPDPEGGQPVTTLRERKKLDAWRAIRAAALALFERQGFEPTTIDQIVEAAGVSRATFFNYFENKESVVFDPDPEDARQWQSLMRSRPADEPLWDSIAAVLVGFTATLGERMTLQWRLKQASPRLAQSTNNLGTMFVADLTAFVTSRSSDPTAMLQLNLARAASATAYQTWDDSEPFDVYLERLERCLQQARPLCATSS